MRLDVKALGFTAGLLWGGAMFLVSVANLIGYGYGAAFLEMMASVYPGYDAAPTFGQVIVGTLYALVDGFVCGLVFAWLYNVFAGTSATAVGP